MTLLFCNIGWMEFYRGQGKDKITGGGSYIKEEGYGHEVCNFCDVNGTLYGYVQPTGNKINLNRLGANAADDKISGITVVWTATRPQKGGTFVIGWYQDAIIFRNLQQLPSGLEIHTQNLIEGYWIKAFTKKAKLLSVDERICKIPRQVKGGMGKSNIWYADKQESLETVKHVQDFIGLIEDKITNPVKFRNNQDQERKVQVEKVAIQTCCQYFERLGYSVKSVEKDNKGWDLEAFLEKVLLKIEVKGLSGSNFSVELTPNEYEAFKEKSNDYRLVVVTDALTSPQIYICRFSQEQDEWLIEGQESLSLRPREKIGATLTISQNFS